MGKLLEVVSSLHNQTPRDYLGRMLNHKVQCMQKAKLYEFDFWDGDRQYGYGGYHYDGRWKSVAEKLIQIYSLNGDSKILDVGCGKAHLLYELKLLLPGAECVGFDISNHALNNAPSDIRDNLFRHKAQDPFPYGDRHFDLVISLATLHNLRLFDLPSALHEIERVGKHGYIMVESYRNESEMFNLECWALTMESLFDTSEWIWLYSHFGYSGDYEFIYFE
jgi:ubiquinone/menaquinone biosynthesis C-methylase UbiE